MRIDEELGSDLGLNEGRRLEEATVALPAARLEIVKAWGGASEAMAYVYRPATVEDLRQVFRTASSSGRTVGLRGSGNSYGDATLNSEQIVLDMRRMNRVLEWDPQSGRIRVEHGVTIRRFWEHVIEDGWWPAVVPGTAKPTTGRRSMFWTPSMSRTIPINGNDGSRSKTFHSNSTEKLPKMTRSNARARRTLSMTPLTRSSALSRTICLSSIMIRASLRANTSDSAGIVSLAKRPAKSGGTTSNSERRSIIFFNSLII